MYKYKRWKDLSAWTALNQQLLVLGIGKLDLGVMHEMPTGVILNDVLHVPTLRDYLLSLRAIDKVDLDLSLSRMACW